MLTFNSVTTSHTVTVTAVDDNVIEDEEMFTLSLTTSAENVTLQPDPVDVSITDNTSKYIYKFINRTVEGYQFPILSSGDIWV